MITTARRLAVGAVPAALAVALVAGCNDSAPSAEAPATSASGAGTGPASATQSTEPAVPTDTGVPTQSSTSSSPTGDPAKVCTTNSDVRTPSELGSKTKKGSWGKPLDLKQKYSGTVSVTPKTPVAKKAESDDVLGPKDGQQYLLISVTVKLKDDKESTLGGTYFTLRDTKNNVCDYNSISSVISDQQRFGVAALTTSRKTYTGTLVYEVPKGQDYKNYTLLYLESFGTGKSSEATVAWSK